MDFGKEEDLSEQSTSEQDWSDDDIPIDTGANDFGSSFLMDELLSESIEMLGDRINYKPENGHLELNFKTSTMPLPVKQALGLADVDNILIEVIFESRTFGAGTPPRSVLRQVRRETPLAELVAAAVEHVAASEPVSIPVSPRQEDEEASLAAPNSSDSTSDEELTHLPKQYKQPVVTAVAYQFANITKKKLADGWPETKHATWKQARSWIPNLYSYLAERLLKLGDHCIICDDLQLVSGIKPVACSKALCSHQFDEMGFGASMDIIYNSPTVVDLLISMAAAAASNPNLQHRQRFFACPNPPSDFVSEDLRHINCTNMNDNMGIKWQELQQVLADLPAVEKMAAAEDLHAFLNKYHKHAYRLVRWILSTCRIHIVELDAAEQIPGMNGRQFKLFTNTFEREVAFQKLKLEQQGSCFLFHGSPFMKWHSIMRTCLQNFSNTQFMTSGAAYGGGVYTAKHVGLACASNVQLCMGAEQVPSACKHTALYAICLHAPALIIRQLQLIRGHV
ncbi:TPA: Poly [ADP-ribose] polymerase 6, variant 3 [Trebouxia sp. C0005]